MSASFDRRRALAKLHVAKAKLALTDESYRAILRRVAGVESAANATDVQLVALIAEMRRFGFTDPPVAARPELRKIRALWTALGPHLESSSDAALRAFCKRQTGVDRLEWLDPARANQVIEGLKAWLVRVSRTK